MNETCIKTHIFLMDNYFLNNLSKNMNNRENLWASSLNQIYIRYLYYQKTWIHFKLLFHMCINC